MKGGGRSQDDFEVPGLGEWCGHGATEKEGKDNRVGSSVIWHCFDT